MYSATNHLPAQFWFVLYLVFIFRLEDCHNGGPCDGVLAYRSIRDG